MSRPPLVLIGPMASGKTRIGKRLAKKLGTTFVDTDKLVEAEYGSIKSVFANEGEATFRKYERAAVVEALSRAGVVAFGGGAVLDEQTQADIADCAVVSLVTSADVIGLRLTLSAKRPLLASGGTERWSEIYAERKPLYDRLGKIHVDTSHRPMDAIADELAAWYRSRYGTEQ